MPLCTATSRQEFMIAIFCFSSPFLQCVTLAHTAKMVEAKSTNTSRHDFLWEWRNPNPSHTRLGIVMIQACSIRVALAFATA